MPARKKRQAAEFIEHEMGWEMVKYGKEMRIFQKF
jgi:hypothetical protein